MSDPRTIIELKPQTNDEGKIEYTHSEASPSASNQKNLLKFVNAALGIGFFLLLISFFVTVIIPFFILFLVWVILRDLIHSLKR